MDLREKRKKVYEVFCKDYIWITEDKFEDYFGLLPVRFAKNLSIDDLALLISYARRIAENKR